jgi:hypothetical protein
MVVEFRITPCTDKARPYRPALLITVNRQRGGKLGGKSKGRFDQEMSRTSPT